MGGNKCSEKARLGVWMGWDRKNSCFSWVVSKLVAFLDNERDKVCSEREVPFFMLSVQPPSDFMFCVAAGRKVEHLS